MQQLDADAALYVAIEQALREDADLLQLLPGGAHFKKLPLGTTLPALCWIIKPNGRKEQTFGIVNTQPLAVWFKVNTQSSDTNPLPYAGAAANSRVRHLFDGTGADDNKRIQIALDAFLKPRGWHLQSTKEAFPITASSEPIGEAMTEMVDVVGGIYHMRLQPLG